MPFFSGFLKAKSCHIGVNHNLIGRLGIGHPGLVNDWLDGSSIKSSKTIKSIRSVREKNIVQQYLLEQRHNTTVIEQIVYLINNLLCNVSVVFMSAWPWYTKVKHIHHWNPESF